MNKKGLTLVEIIVSIGLISIVMVFLFQVVLTIKKANDRQNTKTNLLITTAIITREVEKDLNSFGLDETISDNPSTNCEFVDNDKNNIVPNSAENIHCVKLTYNGENVKNNEGYILYYTNDKKYFLAYKRGKGNIVETQTVREVSVEPQKDLNISITKEQNEKGYSLNIDIPIKDYNISTNLVINYANSTTNNVNIINRDGLAYYITGAGTYDKGEKVYVKFDFNDYLYEIDNIVCNKNVCSEINDDYEFSFTMPETDVTIYINIKEKPMKINEYLIDIIDNNKPQNNPNASEIGLIRDNTNDTNIRFKGINPNNYIKFNNETWRIIGVFKVTNMENEKLDLVKIVREDSLGKYSWDSSVGTVNKGNGENDWSKADLMNELNNDYLSLNHNDDDTTTWYDGAKNAQTAVYNYNNNIKKEYQGLIESVVWNIGSWNSNDILLTKFNSKTGIDDGMYGKERYNTKTRPKTWTGKIGLIYPTDYAFASEDAKCTKLNVANCTNLNYLSKSSNYWTITHNSGNATNVWNTQSSKAMTTSAASSAYDVYPSLYLKADTKILRNEGDGTKDKPYKIYLEDNEY